MSRWMFLACSGFVGTWLSAQVPIFDQPLSPRIANYEIKARLRPEQRLIEGNERILWYNRTDHQVSELQFHLYLNAFRNSQSTFMRESHGRHRRFEIDSTFGWGFVNVATIRGRMLALEEAGPFVQSSEWPELGESPWSLTESMAFIQPDDGNENDMTAMRVPLPEPIPPGAAVLLEVDFESCLPTPPFARTGAKEDYFFAGQWFPKLAVFEPEGVWNCHQFHLNSEFFADFGTYDVFVTLPRAYVMGATGIEIDVAEDEQGFVTHQYHAEDVHDFAWTASPDFIEFNGQAQDVAIRVLMQPDHQAQGERHLEAARQAVTYFQDWYGDYPFPNLTVVDPRRGAQGSGGMEYPTLITAGTVYNLPTGVRAVEAVIIHEFGHNFWYHLLASNEFEESWMDEGINTYTEIQILSDLYGPESDTIDFLGFSVNDLQLQRYGYASIPAVDPTVRDAWSYYSNGSYGVNSYSKPGVMLTTLQNYLGAETMREIMRAYVKRFSFKHPTSNDFVQVANDVSGQDLNWFFDQALWTHHVIDYSVSHLSSTEIDEPVGLDYTLTRDELVQGTEGKEADDQGEGRYLTTVKLRKLGEFTFPVELEVQFEDGETLRESWDGVDNWKTFTYERDHKVASAQIDPDHKVPMDINYLNNSKTLDRQTTPLLTMATKWTDRIQLLLDILAL